MRIIQGNRQPHPVAACIVYDQPNYQGEQQWLSAGIYSREQLVVQNIRSINVREGTQITFYNTPDPAREAFYINQDVMSVSYSFARMRVEQFVSARDQNNARCLLPAGLYTENQMAKYKTVVVPSGLMLVFFNEPEGVYLLRENTEFVPDAECRQYANYIIARSACAAQEKPVRPSPKAYVRSVLRNCMPGKQPLSLDDLAQFSMGACGGDSCGAADCGGNSCGAAACAGNACGGNACSAASCGADSCGANACPAAMCGANACGANTCGGDLCAVNVVPVVPLL